LLRRSTSVRDSLLRRSNMFIAPR